MTLREVNRVGEGKKNVPKLRFKGYEDDWEQRKAKRLFVSWVDKGYPDLPVLSATQDKGMVRRDENGINIHYDEKNKSGYKRVMPGQFVIHLRSFQGGFAYSEVEGITSPAYTVFDFKEFDKHIPEFWKYVFSSKDFIRRLEKVTYGIRDGRSIGFEDFLTLKFNVPEKREQKVIAEILAGVNNLITLHQRKYDALKTMKKTLLSKMFPKDGEDVPEIRFKGFTDAWEQRKLSDVVNSVDTGKSKFQKEGSSGKYAILGSTSVIGYDDEYDYEGDFLLTARVGANAGSIYRHAGKVKISDNTVFIQASENIEFLYHLLTHFDIKKLSFGTGQPLVKASELKNLELVMPIDVAEQKNIRAFFRNLDKLITLHQRKLDELKNMKKTLLQQMFV